MIPLMLGLAVVADTTSTEPPGLPAVFVDTPSDVVVR
jgi:hypothetical protein